MPASQQSWYRTGLHFCGSCLITLACWAMWLVLGCTLAVLVYITVAKELPVPDFVLRRVEANLAKANLVIKFGRARFDPTGKILLEDVQLRSTRFEEPLLTSQLVYARRSIWSILAGRPVPDEIRLQGATLQLPAMLSPSGTAEPLVSDLVAVIRTDGNLWHIDQLAGHLGPVAVTVQGEVGAPAHAAGAPQLTPEEITTRFLTIGRRLVLEMNRFSAFEDPALALRLENPEATGNTATLLFTAAGARQPWDQPIILGPLAVTGTVRLGGKGERGLHLHAATRSASYRGEYAAENVRAIINAHFAPEDFTGRPGEVLVAASRVTADGESVQAPVMRLDLAGWPRGRNVRTELAAEISGESLTTEVDANLQEKSARLHAEGRASAAAICRVLAKHTPRAAPYFVFHDPVIFNADAVLAPGWVFDRLSSRVASGRLDSHGVKITSTRGRIDIVGTSFLAHDALVTLGDNFGRGSYWMDFATTDYRMLLTGRLRPPEINGWFHGDWWLAFWNEHFAFPAVPPEGDVDVQGRWREAARSEYFGRAEATSPVLQGAAFDRAESLIFLRPHFTHALQVVATRGDGSQRLAGSFKRLTEEATRETNRLEFNVDSSLDTEIYGTMFKGKIDSLLGSLRFARPPQLHVQGTVDGKWPGATPHYTFTGRAEGGLHYYGFPLESAQVTGGVSETDLRLDDIQFSVAGGKGAGRATLNGPPELRRLGFDVYINGADLARSIRAVEEYQANRTGQKTASVTESKFMKRASGGKLDVALSAQGKPDELASYVGTGNASLTGTELGEIHLFGLLSQALSGLSLNFSSLKLDAARTSFRMDGGRLWFPDLKITGPSAVIDARGNFAFATNALDFTAKFKPFEESRTLLTAAIGIVINPITSILELKLSGPLSKPEWSVVVGSSGPQTEAPPPPAEKPATPAAPAGK